MAKLRKFLGKFTKIKSFFAKFSKLNLENPEIIEYPKTTNIRNHLIDKFPNIENHILNRICDEMISWNAENNDSYLCQNCLNYLGNDCPENAIACTNCEIFYCDDCIEILKHNCVICKQLVAQN